jgi:hypothetical protein
VDLEDIQSSARRFAFLRDDTLRDGTLRDGTLRDLDADALYQYVEAEALELFD